MRAENARVNRVDRIKSGFVGAGRASRPETEAVEPRDPATRRDPVAQRSVTEIGVVLRGHIALQSDGVHTLDTIEGDGHLFDEGYLDSLSSVSLVALIEDRYGVQVEEVELVGRLSTVDALAEHIDAVRSDGDGAIDGDDAA